MLDQLKGIVGNAEYWWYFGSIGNYWKGGRQGLALGEFEAGGEHWWSWGHYRSKYVFRDDKVFVCKYAYQSLGGPNQGQDVFTDLNLDKADFVGTPNGPRIADIVWESLSDDQAGIKHRFGFKSMRGTGTFTIVAIDRSPILIEMLCTSIGYIHENSAARLLRMGRPCTFLRVSVVRIKLRA